MLTLIFLALGAHLHWIALLVESYRVFPPGETWLGAERFAEIAGFAVADVRDRRRASPCRSRLVLLLVQIVTGVLSRSAPSLNLFALGLPAGVLAGIAALIVSAPSSIDQLFASVDRRASTRPTSVMAR